MSGGVDSSLAAALLVEQGYDVVGVMLRLWSEVAPGVGSANRCCSLEAVDSARRVAAHLDIPFYLLNVEDAFRARVVEYFIREYVRGRTPNPCLRCNQHIRFGWLLRRALAFDASNLATGHYARIEYREGCYRLLRGVDAARDQSYVLYTLGQWELARVLFPLGDHTKREVRAMARRRGLPAADRPESQDVCFVMDGDYRRFLRDHAPLGAIRAGPILDTMGRERGQHPGLAYYTIGQRKGLGIAAPEALYVVDMDRAQNALIVGPERELGRTELTASAVAWVCGEPPRRPSRVETKIRYQAQRASGTLTRLAADRVHVVFDQPLRDVTPGQGAVFYCGDEVLGGGIID
jgi:tRNA-specific 2-thiouridylase